MEQSLRDVIRLLDLETIERNHYRADQWLLYVQDSPVSSGARGLTRGLIYSQAGELVASATQEGLIRQR